MTATKLVLPAKASATLGDMGTCLCIGHKNTTLEMREWSTDEELMLGELAEKHKDASAWKTAEMVVSTMITNFGGSIFWRREGDSWKPAQTALEREISLQGMWLADVLLAYLHIRIDAFGPDLDMQLQDPFDNMKEFEWTADLNTVKVNRPVDVSKMTFEYQLKKPVQRNGKTIRSFILGPQRWALHTAFETSNRLRVELDAVAGSICGVPDLIDGPFAMDRNILAELRVHKMDLSRMADALEDAAFGAELTIEAVSPKTKKPFTVPIDWRYGTFYKASSR